MLPHRSPKPVTMARDKAVAVQDEVRSAEADLHDTNETLADTVAGNVVSKDDVRAALVHNLQVENQLHDAVKELQVVTDLLKVAEKERTTHDGGPALVAGRSGEGVDSVLKHLSASPGREDLAP
jgi:hypothetical protein